MFTFFLYIITAFLLILSYIKNKKKTIIALKKAWNIFLSVLPQFLAILVLVGLILAVLEPETIKNIIGTQSGIKGMFLASVIGSATIIPVFIAFPIASELLKNGAGLMQIAVFVSTLTTVGFLTISIENKYLGIKVALLRNILALIFSFVVAFIIGVVMG